MTLNGSEGVLLKDLSEPQKYVLSFQYGAASRDDEIAELRQQLMMLHDFVTKISEQIPEKPDYWSSCSQCEYNSSDAKDIIESLAATDPKP